VILGPSNSPYAFGFFHFRAEYPHDYPISAPQVKITTTEGGRTRFNPNLYSDGKGTYYFCQRTTYNRKQRLSAFLES
jgi:ubiquitin-protein ligase